MISKIKRFGKRKGLKTILFFSLLGILAITLIGFLIFSNLKISQKRAKLTEQLEYLQKQVQTLKEKKQALESGISHQKTEEYLEEVAREKLNLKKLGEKVVAFTEEKENEENGAGEKKNFFKRILEKMKFW